MTSSLRHMPQRGEVSSGRGQDCIQKLLTSNGEPVCRNGLAHCRVNNNCDRLAAERPEIKIDDRWATS